MFTGLIKELGTVASLKRNREGIEIGIYSTKLISEIEVDDSVAINGACQTATRVTKEIFYVQAVHTTLEKTGLKSLKLGQKVNLELALRLSDRLGGHLVQGHVNAVGMIKNIISQGENYLLELKIPREDLKYVIKEGSIAIDGISLTLAQVERASESVTLSVIPHTWNHTILKFKRKGDQVNLEYDFFAKYVENFLVGNLDNEMFPRANVETEHQVNVKSKMSEKWLRSKGF
jgi:riboflavin synthase